MVWGVFTGHILGLLDGLEQLLVQQKTFPLTLSPLAGSFNFQGRTNSVMFLGQKANQAVSSKYFELFTFPRCDVERKEVVKVRAVFGMCCALCCLNTRNPRRTEMILKSSFHRV